MTRVENFSIVCFPTKNIDWVHWQHFAESFFVTQNIIDSWATSERRGERKQQKNKSLSEISLISRYLTLGLIQLSDLMSPLTPKYTSSMAYRLPWFTSLSIHACIKVMLSFERIYIENPTRILHSFHANSLERKRNVGDEERFFLFFSFLRTLRSLITFILTISWTRSPFKSSRSDMGFLPSKEENIPSSWNLKFTFDFPILFIFIFFLSWTRISLLYLTL